MWLLPFIGYVNIYLYIKLLKCIHYRDLKLKKVMKENRKQMVYEHITITKKTTFKLVT